MPSNDVESEAEDDEGLEAPPRKGSMRKKQGAKQRESDSKKRGRGEPKVLAFRFHYSGFL